MQKVATNGGTWRSATSQLFTAPMTTAATNTNTRGPHRAKPAWFCRLGDGDGRHTDARTDGEVQPHCEEHEELTHRDDSEYRRTTKDILHVITVKQDGATIAATIASNKIASHTPVFAIRFKTRWVRPEVRPRSCQPLRTIPLLADATGVTTPQPEESLATTRKSVEL